MADVNEIIASLRREGRHGPLIEPLVPRNAAAADALEAYKSAVENVLALHHVNAAGLCGECRDYWPCPTARAIRAALGATDE